MNEARRNNEALPLPRRIDETLTIDDAYDVQKRVVRDSLGDERPAGFKAGLTSRGSQMRFKTNAPIAGVLFRAGQAPDHATLSQSELRGLHIETEVALRIGRTIDQRMHSVAQLQQHIDGVAAAIELPNLAYQSPEQLTAVDIVATNVAAAKYILGTFAPPSIRDPNETHPRLVCAGRELNTGSARDALGDQWQAALWLVNTMIDQGWSLQAGQILLTGALGQMIPAQPGSCSADYGSWGTISFQVVP